MSEPINHSENVEHYIDPDAPKVPIKTALCQVVDTYEKERKLMDFIRSRFEGSTAALSGDGTNSWVSRREEADSHYRNDFSNRIVNDSIYENSNLSINLPKRFIRTMKARAYNDLLSVTPLLNVRIEGDDDSTVAAAVIQRYVTFFLEQIKSVNVFREAVLHALSRGETVIKTTWESRTRRWRRMAEVLIGQNNEVVCCKNGQPVQKTDARTEPNEAGAVYLLRDPSVLIPEVPKWERRMVEIRRKAFEGLEMKNVCWKDFICNTSEECIQESDFLAHRYDWPLGDVEMMLAHVKDTPETKEFLTRARSHGQTGHTSEERKPNDSRGEEKRDDTAMPKVHLAECHVSMSIAGDGIIDNIVVVCETQTWQPLYYDYLENISPTFGRPFQVVRIEPVPSRWYGTGFYELFSDKHTFVDLMFNRINFANSQTGNIRIVNPNALEETFAGKPLKFGRPENYHLREGYTIEDVLKIVKFPFDGEHNQKMLDFMMQLSQLEAGMVNVGGQDTVAALPSSGLATGIKSLDRMANILQKDMFVDIISGIEAVLRDAVSCVLVNFSYEHARMLMGKEAADILEKMRDVTALSYSVEISLSNTRDSDKLKASNQALATMQYWEQLAPEAKIRYRGLFLDILKSLQVDDAEQLLGNTDAQPQDGGQSSAPAPSAPLPPMPDASENQSGEAAQPPNS